jgi:hypothetical protein
MLSKSKYIKGLQCEKRLWLDKHRRDLMPPIAPATQARFDSGHEVGDLAQLRYPGGLDASPEDYRKLHESIAKTKAWIDAGVPVIYEATFEADGVLIMMDVLIREGEQWKAIEVKSSTGVKEYHINDLAIQFYVMKGAGIQISDIGILHLDNTYERQGNLDLDGLFHFESLYDVIIELQDDIPNRIESFKSILTSDVEPVVDIGPHCSNPFTCDFIEYCWKHIPSYSIFDLSRISDKAWTLYENGIIGLEDLTEDSPLSANQRLEVDMALTDEVHVDVPAIKEFLDQLAFPLYFFDFETIMPAIPLFDGTRPYQQLVFQYSLHILDAPESEPVHQECLPNPTADPRRIVVEQMIKDLSDKGSIVAYNMSFEQTRICELIKDFPQYEEALSNILERFVDLEIPFKKKWYYSAQMKGRSSLKVVLPAIVPDLKYSDLAISEGGTASRTYEAMLSDSYSGDKEWAMNNLKAYCKMDTQAMVSIWRYIFQLIQ